MTTKEQTSQAPETDMQTLGHQIGSLASVLVVAAVQFGLPLTPGQVAWALFATIYGMRHRIPRRVADDPVDESGTTTR